MTEIERRARRILTDLPSGVRLMAAAKTRSPEEIAAAIAGGVQIVGQNYVQEAERAIAALGRDAASWQMIGHLQRNKVKAAVRLFHAIQTVDSIRLAEKIDAECRKIGRVISVLVEVNSGREAQKAGLLPEDVADFVREISSMPSIRIEGLMTMGPLTDDPETLRPPFRLTKDLFDRLEKLAIPDTRMETLSMGMSDSYHVAIEEGANMVRIGTALFGPR
jgi:pyridoxal phosphate enzyme (YggS family)